MIIWSGKGLLVVLAMGLGMLAGRVAAQMLAAHIYFFVGGANGQRGLRIRGGIQFRAEPLICFRCFFPVFYPKPVLDGDLGGNGHLAVF